MKKIISILLVFAMLAGVASISVSAEGEDYSVYPESDHDYANDCWKTWKYIHPEETEGLFVTFSADTYFEPGFSDEFTNKNGDNITIRPLFEDENQAFNFGDTGSFTGDELASKTIYIPASGFSISLYTDESVTAYGFKIDRIDTAIPENTNAICYNLKPNSAGIEKYYEFYNEGETVTVADGIPSRFRKFAGKFSGGNKYRCGWATEPGGELAYDDGSTITPNGGVINLYAVYTPLSISADEVFIFQNFSEVFDRGYFMTPEHHNILLSNARRLGLPGWISYSFYKDFPQNEFQGACFGLASTVFLQHHGVIDMLSLQEDADTVIELKPTDEVVSTVNYYQALSVMSFLCQNKSYEPGTDGYKKQLKALFDTVSNGNPALLSIYTEERYIFGNMHAMLVTGAYTDTEGNHYLLVYEAQKDYAERNITVLPVASDFSSLSSRHGSAFCWTDDYTHLEAFDMDGEGPIINWYLKFVPQMGILLKMLFRYLPVLLGK